MNLRDIYKRLSKFFGGDPIEEANDFSAKVERLREKYDVDYWDIVLNRSN